MDGPYPGDGLPGLFSDAAGLHVDDRRHRPAAPGQPGRRRDRPQGRGRRQRHHDGSGSDAGGGCTRRPLRRRAQRPPSSSWDPVPGRHVVPRLRRPGRELHHHGDARRRPDHEQHDARATTLGRRRARCRRARPAPPTTGTSRPCWPSRLRHLDPCRRIPPLPGARGVPQGVAGDRRTGVQPTRTPARSRSPGRTTSTPTPAIACGGEQGNQTRQDLPDPGRQRPVVRVARSTPRSSTRPPTRRYDDLYPDGTYFWRVQALRRREPRPDLVRRCRRSPRPARRSRPSLAGRRSPGARAPRRSGGPPQPFAASYTVEVYKNNDLSFSAANRVFSATVKTTAYAPSSPIPAAGTPYVWRVRRNDASGNPGPWSAPQSFFSSGVRAQPAQPDGRHLAEERGCPVRVDRGTRCGELQAQHHRDQGQQRDHGGHGLRAQRPEHGQLRVERDGLRRCRQPAGDQRDAPVQGRRHCAVHQEVRA